MDIFYISFCQAHFTASEVQFVLNKKPELKENKNSRKLYLELRKNFGVKAQFSELVMLCKNCRYGCFYFASIHSCSIYKYIYCNFRCVFWSSYGHPCLSSVALEPEEAIETPLPLTPTAFLSFFNIST